jgi:hypothetical protein
VIPRLLANFPDTQPIHMFVPDENHLTVALATTDDAPRIIVNHREVLLVAWRKGVIEIITESSRFLPSICGIAEEHA